MHQTSQRGIQKIHSGLKLLFCGLVVFIDMNTYVNIGDRRSKTFLKEDCAIALDSCFLFTKKNVKHGIAEHDIDSIYGDIGHF